jgi:nitrilase
MSPTHAAVIQAAPLVFDTARTLEKLADLAADAARRGAQVAVFPEAFVGGYPKGLDFGARVGLRSAAGREQFRRYYDSAIEVPGPATEAIGKAAQAAGMYLVVGVIERDGGTLYCTVVFVGPNGQLLGKHRKLMPTAMERLIWGCGDGSTLTVVDTPVGRIGAVICWENYMPLLRMAMYGKGVQLYCAPTVDDRETWLPTMRHIALEGRCFVLSACQYLERAQLPADYPLGPDAGTGTALIRGGSCIVGPLGQVLAGPTFDAERILMAELDLAEIIRGKFDLDVVGHYARPDVFQLSVNENSVLPVVNVPMAPSAEPAATREEPMERPRE